MSSPARSFVVAVVLFIAVGCAPSNLRSAPSQAAPVGCPEHRGVREQLACGGTVAAEVKLPPFFHGSVCSAVGEKLCFPVGTTEGVLTAGPPMSCVLNGVSRVAGTPLAVAIQATSVERQPDRRRTTTYLVEVRGPTNDPRWCSAVAEALGHLTDAGKPVGQQPDEEAPRAEASRQDAAGP